MLRFWENCGLSALFAHPLALEHEFDYSFRWMILVFCVIRMFQLSLEGRMMKNEFSLDKQQEQKPAKPPTMK